jgi:hypothetical protein
MFEDLSYLLVSPSPVEVRILVDLDTGMPSNALGQASSLYSIPGPVLNGIVDGWVYQTIIRGTDASPNNFHGFMKFNFNNPNISWHVDYDTPCLNTLYDLYTVALHEATHALGFNSFIREDGNTTRACPILS